MSRPSSPRLDSKRGAIFSHHPEAWNLTGRLGKGVLFRRVFLVLYHVILNPSSLHRPLENFAEIIISFQDHWRLICGPLYSPCAEKGLETRGAGRLVSFSYVSTHFISFLDHLLIEPKDPFCFILLPPWYIEFLDPSENSIN